MGSTIGQPGWYAYFSLPAEGEPGYATITTPAISTANGVFSAGGAVGTLFIMWSCDFFGRRASIQFGAFFSLFGGALQAGSNSLAMFQAGRFICGLGIGILVTVCPMYLSEMSSALRRGWLVGHHAIFLVFGYMLAGWVGYACYYATGPLPEFGWRFPLALQCLPALVLLMGSPWLPRSPRWLISKGKLDEAQRVLERLRESPDDPNNLAAKEEFFQTKEQIQLEAERLATSGNVWKAVFTRKTYRKRMAIGFLTQWGAEFGGPLIINNYAVLLYKNLGMEGGVIYNPLGAWLHDKVNSRRGMYMIGFIGIIISTSCLAAMTAQYAGTTNKVGNGFGIFFMYLYLAFQGTFCDTTMYLYVSEIFPTEIRPIGMGFSLFGQFAATLILLQTAPMGFGSVGWKYYLVIICWSAFFIPVIYFFFPETAGLTLEEIAQNFGEEVAVNLTGATDEEKARLDHQLATGENIQSPISLRLEKEAKSLSTNEAGKNVPKA
ncbi:Major facilitator superfamily domain general substrate transporter [Penicillium vulpinum]|uniref:Major facilitator superfamily domain general substrate transporter n=1 Tax=Penicillium vulpinum TaxID=29845 RepID=UPI002548E040|nr:Major facilitator superfamily domain general substrate transporter [Penicillium vulpinum]KAJ5960484.1 Major facilitator superfamily domain general substrate transporter [Penicillium vulpinum]